MPDEDRFCPAVNKAERSLKSVKSSLWAGMVWINMDPDCVSLKDYLGPIWDEWQLRNIIIEGVNLGEIYRSQFEASARKSNGDLDVVIACGMRPGIAILC